MKILNFCLFFFAPHKKMTKIYYVLKTKKKEELLGKPTRQGNLNPFTALLCKLHKAAAPYEKRSARLTSRPEYREQ